MLPTPRARTSVPTGSDPSAQSWSRSPSSPIGSSGLTFDAAMKPSSDMLVSKTTLPIAHLLDILGNSHRPSTFRPGGRPRLIAPLAESALRA